MSLQKPIISSEANHLVCSTRVAYIKVIGWAYRCYVSCRGLNHRYAPHTRKQASQPSKLQNDKTHLRPYSVLVSVVLLLWASCGCPIRQTHFNVLVHIRQY